MKRTGLFTLLTALLLFPSLSTAWEPYDRVIATVNNIPIVESEIEAKISQLTAKGTLRGSAASRRQQVLDYFIERALVRETADQQSIIISDDRVLNHLETLMDQYLSSQVPDPKKREKAVTRVRTIIKARMNYEKVNAPKDEIAQAEGFMEWMANKEKISFRAFFEDIRSEMMKQQVMSIAIGVSPPTDEEIQSWYNANKSKLGYEVRVKHILIRPKNRSLAEEKRVNSQLASIRAQIVSGQATFEAMAQKYSEDPGSRALGGDIGWQNLANLDPYFAGNVFRLQRVGQVSNVFKSGFGYHIAKFLGKRPVTLENVADLIRYKLYSEKMEEQFDKWVAERKSHSEIQVFVETSGR